MEVLQSGLLQGKIPRRKGAWMVYYLELTDTYLRIFSDADRRKHLYNVKISSKDKVMEEQPKKTHNYKFHFSTSAGRHTFKCNTSDHRREWVLKIQKIITRAQLGQIADMPGTITSSSFDPEAVGQSPTTPKQVEVPKPPTPIHVPTPTVPPIAPTAPVAPSLPFRILPQPQPTVPVTASVTGAVGTPKVVERAHALHVGPLIPPKRRFQVEGSTSPSKTTTAPITAPVTIPQNGVSHMSAKLTGSSSPIKRAPRPPPLEIATSGPGQQGGPPSSATDGHRRTPITPKRHAPPIPVQKSSPKHSARLQSSPKQGMGRREVSGPDSRQLDHHTPTAANAIALQAVLKQRRADESVSHREHMGNDRDRSVNGTRAGLGANGYVRPPVDDSFHHQLSEKLFLPSKKENSSAQPSSRSPPMPAHPRVPLKEPPNTSIGNGINMSRSLPSDSYMAAPGLPPKPKKHQSDAFPYANGKVGSAHPQKHTSVGGGTSVARLLARDTGNSNTAALSLPQRPRKLQNDTPPHTSGGVHPQVHTTRQFKSPMSDVSVGSFPLDYSALKDCVWFWGLMSREDCEHKLTTEGVEGNIAVRARSGRFIISCRQADGFHHHRVVQDGQVFRFEKATKQLECHSLVELLDVFMERNSKDKNLSLFGSGGPGALNDPLDQDYELVVISDTKLPLTPNPSKKGSGKLHFTSPSVHRRGWTKPLPPIPSDNEELITQENPHYKPILHPPHLLTSQQQGYNLRIRTK